MAESAMLENRLDLGDPFTTTIESLLAGGLPASRSHFTIPGHRELCRDFSQRHQAAVRSFVCKNFLNYAAPTGGGRPRVSYDRAVTAEHLP